MLKADGKSANGAFTYEYSGEESLSLYDPELLHTANKIVSHSYNGQVIGIQITDVELLDSEKKRERIVITTVVIRRT